MTAVRDHPSFEVVLPPEAPREEWLKARRAGLGGSDAAAALGLDPYRSPYALWAEKTGRLDAAAEEESEPMLMGRLLEPVVLGRYADKHPEAHLQPTPGLIRAAGVKWLLGTPDAIRGRWEPVEAKAPGYDFAREWDEEDLPLRYRVQTYIYGAILGASRGVVVAIIGGQRYEEREIDFSPDSTEKLLDRLGTWWERHVVADNPPPIDPHASTTAALRAMYAGDPEETAILAPEMAEDLRRYWGAHRAVDAAGKLKDLYANRLRAALGNAAAAWLEGEGSEKPAVTWTPGTERRVNLERLRTEYPDVAAAVTEEKPTRTLRPSKRFNKEITT